MTYKFHTLITALLPPSSTVRLTEATVAPEYVLLQRLLLCAILACGLGIRLIKISQPYVDAWSWRQADVAMIAENFYRRGFALFYPQIN